MDLAGDLLQDLAGYLGVEELPSRAHFPVALEAFKATLGQVCCGAARRTAAVVGAVLLTSVTAVLLGAL